MNGLPFFEYVNLFRDDLIFATQKHLLVSLYTLLIATILGIGLGMLVYRSKTFSTASIGTLAIGFTIPSIALFGLLVPILGTGLAVGFPVLTMYGLLPILRNTIVGLNSVDKATLDAARGIGMGRLRMLWQIEIPLAWPVILTGVRVAGQLIVGIVVIGAYVRVPGLGEPIFNALQNLGAVNTFNQALSATILVAVIALVLDATFILVRRYSTPRGIRV
ncbi:MAG: ABC transporter permease [Actinomycetota bacterium]|nr:ABC transporter permease [Actinomycetota bacterium]